MKSRVIIVVTRRSYQVIGRVYSRHYWEVEMHVPGVGIFFRIPRRKASDVPPTKDEIFKLVDRGFKTGKPFLEKRDAKLPEEVAA